MTAKLLTLVTILMANSGLGLAAEPAEQGQAHPPAATHEPVAGQPAAQATGMMPLYKYMQKMQYQMNRIHQTQDPQERIELLDTHMDSIHEMMNMMRELLGDGEKLSYEPMSGRAKAEGAASNCSPAAQGNSDD